MKNKKIIDGKNPEKLNTFGLMKIS